MHAATPRALPADRRDWIAAAVLAGLAAAVFYPAVGHGFVTFDDPYYVFQNPNVLHGLTPAGVRWAFTTFDNSNWHPLTWLSLQLDVSLWGTGPAGFHGTNVALHAANAALVFLALRALTGAFWRSAAVALLFAVHPLRVESVAWVTERKDVLSALFGLLALWAYAGYAAAPSARRYLLVAAALVLSLLAKPMFVTLPCLLLVLDWWPLRRVATTRTEPTAKSAGVQRDAPPTQAAAGWPQLILEKLPLAGLIVASAAVTFHVQASQGAVMSLGALPPAVRLENAVASYGVYLLKTACPVNLGVFYPYPDTTRLAWQAALAAAALLAVTGFAIAWRRQRPYLLAGWLWYLGTLVPVIGIVQVGAQAYADRYTYFPQIGVLLALCWGSADLVRENWRAAVAVTAVTAGLLTAVTEQQLAYWSDSVSLWNHTIAAAGKSATSLTSLGRALEDRGDFAGALRAYHEAIGLEPHYVLGLTCLGGLLSKMNQPDDALPYLEKACQLSPDNPIPYSYFGNVYIQKGMFDKAVEQEERAISLNPQLSPAYCSLGQAEAARGNLDRAVDCYARALRLWPEFAEAHQAMAVALLKKGESEEAIRHLVQALRANPRYGEAHLVLGQALEARNDFEHAGGHYELAVRYLPQSAVAWHRLGLSLARSGVAAEAERCLDQAVRLNPASKPYRTDLARVLDARAAAYAGDGQWAEALAAERRALDLAVAAGNKELEGLATEQLRRLERREADVPKPKPGS